MISFSKTIKILNDFLQSSTIHGLGYIAATQRFSRMFWIFVVFIGFSCAAALINIAFKNWRNSPISTTIETLPISKIKFPNIAICPPKNSFTSLNYDLTVAANMTLDVNKREDLKIIASEALQDRIIEEIMKNVTCINDTNRFSSWYYGHARVRFFSKDPKQIYLSCRMDHYTENIISTAHYGEKFDLEKIELNTYVSVYFYPPESIIGNENVR